MSGTLVTERVSGMPSGFPAEIDADSKVRFVAPLLVNMSERSTDFLKYIGGPEKFPFNSTKVEWVEDDVWNRRVAHGGLDNSADTSLPVYDTGTSGEAAHRYPIGTILYNVTDGEYVRVTAHVAGTPDTLTLTRDIYAAVSEGGWDTTDEVVVAGFSMDENDDYTFRPTAIFSMPYNHPQIIQMGVKASWRRQETALYGLRGTDLDYRAMDMVAEGFVAMDQASVHGYRFVGSSSVPASAGGMKFYVTSANGSQVSDLSTAALTRKDIDDKLQALYYAVGGDKMARTIICSAWAKRKISSFFSAAERLGPGTTDAGVVVDRLNTDFGVVDILLNTEVAKNELFFVNRESIQMGHFGQLGRPQLRELPPSNTGPRTEKVFYADISLIVAGVQAMGRIYNFSTSS